MDYSQLRNRVTLWPHMHFSGALYEVRGALYEVYATDTSRKHVSRIFLVRLTDAHEAVDMCLQVTAWLERINRGREHGEPVVLYAGAARKASRLRSGQEEQEEQPSRDDACAQECICGATRWQPEKKTGRKLA